MLDYPSEPDFSFMSCQNDNDMLVSAYSVIQNLEKWHFLRDFVVNPTTGFMFNTDPEICSIMDKINDAYPGHSGTSMGVTMRSMQYIAKNGFCQFYRFYLGTNSSSLRRSEATSGVRLGPNSSSLLRSSSSEATSGVSLGPNFSASKLAPQLGDFYPLSLRKNPLVDNEPELDDFSVATTESDQGSLWADKNFLTTITNDKYDLECKICDIVDEPNTESTKTKVLCDSGVVFLSEATRNQLPTVSDSLEKSPNNEGQCPMDGLLPISVGKHLPEKFEPKRVDEVGTFGSESRERSSTDSDIINVSKPDYPLDATFDFMGNMEARMIKSAYQVIHENNAWQTMLLYTKAEHESYELPEDPDVIEIMDKISKAYGLHSGSSCAWTMRHIDFIAKHGYENYKSKCLESQKEEY